MRLSSQSFLTIQVSLHIFLCVNLIVETTGIAQIHSLEFCISRVKMQINGTDLPSQSLWPSTIQPSAMFSMRIWTISGMGSTPHKGDYRDSLVLFRVQGVPSTTSPTTDLLLLDRNLCFRQWTLRLEWLSGLLTHLPRQDLSGETESMLSTTDGRLSWISTDLSNKDSVEKIGTLESTISSNSTLFQDVTFRSRKGMHIKEW
jgi:hypothetical protein